MDLLTPAGRSAPHVRNVGIKRVLCSEQEQQWLRMSDMLTHSIFLNRSDSFSDYKKFAGMQLIWFCFYHSVQQVWSVTQFDFFFSHNQTDLLLCLLMLQLEGSVWHTELVLIVIVEVSCCRAKRVTEFQRKRVPLWGWLIKISKQVCDG